MELLLGVEPGGGADRHDVKVSVTSSHTGRDLAHALARYCGIPTADRLSVQRAHACEALDIEATVADLGLVSGDVVALNAPARTSTNVERSPLRLAVSFGPDAGSSHDLFVGDHSLGRSSQCDITVADPQISRHQLDVAVDEAGNVSITPADEAQNFVRVNGTIIDDATSLSLDDIVQIGASSMVLRTTKPAANRSRDFFGGVPFHRTPYFREPLTTAGFAAIKDVPKKPEPRRFQYLAAMMPLVMGISMAFMIGNMRFLMFAAMSPVMAIGSWYDQRKHSGIAFDASVERFGEALVERRIELNDAMQTERRARHRNSPDIELLANRAENRLAELWLRDRHVEDFLDIRVGIGTVTPNLDIKASEQGDREFRDQVAEVIAEADRLVDVPVTLDLAKLGTAGFVGQANDVTALVSAVILQACCLHSPEDLVVMAAVPHERGLDEWLKWIPHSRSSSSPLAVDHLVGDAASTDMLVRALVKVAEQRVSAADKTIDRRWPWLLVTLDASLEPDPSSVSRLLDLCPEAGISVLWLSNTNARVPRQAEAVVDCRSIESGELSAVNYTDPERPTRHFDIERVGAGVSREVGQWLAPMRDASASNAATSIPRMVSLFGSLSVDEMTPGWIAEQWSIDRGYSLQAPIGMTETGPLLLDLVEHGPHGLIGGTSGAGKSELVQSLVVNLMAYNSPERINFLFVDYKGGALSELFKDVPHSVGAVTNLDALLALRALTSLTAELDRRMELFKGKATDIREMIKKFPKEAPPSLVIVVDEFAALVRELPEFVDGIVSIAERGRSLGIHLLMSTQRPSGAINDNIQQNTNLRIALRMLDSGESRNVIGSTEAAMIPGPLKGRGFARLGPGELIAFQSAWSGAPMKHAAGPPPVSVDSFSHGPSSMVPRASAPAAAEVVEEEPATQLDVTIQAIIDASAMLGHKPGRPPWMETLPSTINLLDVLEDERAARTDVVGSTITFGMIDDPGAQDQYPAAIDLESGGALAIFGNGGSGKTTLLKTIAASAAIRDSQAGGDGLTIFSLDFASRELGLVARLPQTEAIAMGDDLEGVTRILSILDQQMTRRRAQMAEAAARGDEAPRYSQIMLIIDGYENLVQTFEMSNTPGLKLHVWSEVVTRLITDGRQVGINTVFGCNRRGAVRSNVMSAVSNRIVLRQSDESGYMELGIPAKMARGLELEAGQGFVNGDQMVQIASLFGAASGDGDDAAVDIADTDPTDDRALMIEISEHLIGQTAPELRSQILPEELGPIADTDLAGRLIRLGRADLTLAAVDVDLTWNNLVVAGPPRSGRSSTLALIAQQFQARGEEVWVVGSKGSPLQELGVGTKSAFGRVADVTPLLEEMATMVDSYPDAARVLIFDDVDLIDDRPMYESLGKLIEGGVRCVGSVASLKAFGQNPLYGELKNSRAMLVLQPDGPRDVMETAGVTPDLRPGVRMVPGRAVLVADRIPTVMQVSSPSAPADNDIIQPTGDLSEMPATADWSCFVAPVIPGRTSVPMAAAGVPSEGADQNAAPPEDKAVVELDDIEDDVTIDSRPFTSFAPTAAKARPDRLCLQLASGERFPISAPVVVGRKPATRIDELVIQLNDPLVSSVHLAVSPMTGKLKITDIGSTNGTVLSGPDHHDRVMEPTIAEFVGPGTTIELGTTTLTVVLDEQ